MYDTIINFKLSQLNVIGWRMHDYVKNATNMIIHYVEIVAKRLQHTKPKKRVIRIRTKLGGLKFSLLCLIVIIFVDNGASIICYRCRMSERRNFST